MLFFPKISDAAFCASPGVTTCATSMSGNVHQQNSQRRPLCASSIIGLMKSYFIFWGKKKNYRLENNSSSVYPWGYEIQKCYPTMFSEDGCFSFCKNLASFKSSFRFPLISSHKNTPHTPALLQQTASSLWQWTAHVRMHGLDTSAFRGHHWRQDAGSEWPDSHKQDPCSPPRFCAPIPLHSPSVPLCSWPPLGNRFFFGVCTLWVVPECSITETLPDRAFSDGLLCLVVGM